MHSELVGAEWRSGPVDCARTFGQRWRGIHPGRGLLIATRSVHTFGFGVDLWVCGLIDMTVVKVRRLSPWRVIWWRGVDANHEFAIEFEPPALGLQI
jgi:hypothetical protein